MSEVPPLNYLTQLGFARIANDARPPEDHSAFAYATGGSLTYLPGGLRKDLSFWSGIWSFKFHPDSAIMWTEHDTP